MKFPTGSEEPNLVSRRRFLGVTAAAAAAALLPTRTMASALPSAGAGAPDRVLSFFNTHTSERLTTAYCCAGEYQPEALQAINYILRDFRANEIKAIDPTLLDLLHELGGTLARRRRMRSCAPGAVPILASRPAVCTWSGRPLTSAFHACDWTICVRPLVPCSAAASGTILPPTSYMSIPGVSDTGSLERSIRCGENRPRCSAAMGRPRALHRRARVPVLDSGSRD
jgi:hypothetical protein